MTPGPMQQIAYDGEGVERAPGFAWLTGCTLWLSALVVCPLTYFIVGVIAPPGDSKERQGIRELFEMVGLDALSFFADITIAQLLATIVAGFFVILAGGVMGQRKGFEALKRLPCRRCGATPLAVTLGAPLLLTCERCRIVWEVHYEMSSGGDGSHDHHHHHNTF